KKIVELKMEVLTKKRIFIVEDEFDLAENIKDILTHSNYEVIGIESDGKCAIKQIIDNKPDMVLIDIKLSGSLSGIEVCSQIKQNIDTLAIFITAHSDQEILEKIVDVDYDSFILKPFTKETLKSNIYLNLLRKENIVNKNNYINVRDKGLIVPLQESEIMMLKADGLYTKIYTKDKQYMVRDIMKDVSHKLTSDCFLRIHKSYIVNINHVTAYNSKEVNVDKYVAPIRRGFFRELAKKLVLQMN
ncbi:MAG: response regulator transcription factor, partial [Cyclobacteriaceae bacterium]|nr:response regulator transcription factor [Cyclobacteriaceae bacterium]